MRSSYAENNYAEVFKAIIDGFKPEVCVELGVLDGYSTMAIALALECNKRGSLRAIDLFEGYQYKHGYMDVVQGKLEEYGLEKIVTLHRGDAFEAAASFNDNTVSLLHVDLSNTGDIFNTIMEQWDPKMVTGGIILFEGGTEERDQVEWMVKFNKTLIKPAIETNKIVEEKYIFATYFRFPGLTMLLKKR